MQGMLAQFKGLVVDWRRGEVKPAGGCWEQLEVGACFWRDLEWWKANLATQSLAPMDPEPSKAEAVLTDTDASDWGTGQVLWLDGGREESVLRFTAAERRRPINWRELLGVLRVCEVGGERLRGKVVLLENILLVEGRAGLRVHCSPSQLLLSRSSAFLCLAQHLKI